MPAQTYRHEVEAAIDQVLLNEARRNELKLAYVRAVIVTISAALDGLIYCFPQQTMGVASMPIANVLISGGWGVVAVALAAALRAGWYRLWMRMAVPLLDGVLVCVVFVNLWRSLATSEPRILVNMSAICSLLAVSGGIRLTQNAAVMTTALAICDFVIAAILFDLSPALIALAGSSILASGFLGLWMTGIVRKQVQGETGRSMMARLLPKKVVEEAFDDPMGLAARPRGCEVTIVITDLRGFTAYSERLPPEQVFDFLNRVQGALATIVREWGGTVDKFMGDGMLAVFGAPEPLADHASRAVQAADAMLKAMDAMNVRLGIGIHSGPVVTGYLGSGAKIEFTVVGDTVNVASRIEALTKDKGVDALISADTVRRAGRPLSIQSMGKVPVRGRSEPLEIHALSRT